MSWDYSGFQAEKAEAGRRLLASDPAYASSEDLKLLVEDKDLVDALRATFLTPSGARRRDVSAREKRRGLVLFLHSVRRKLELPARETLNTEHSAALLTALREALSLITLSMLCGMPFEPTYQAAVVEMCSREWSARHALLAGRLEERLRAEGYEPLLPAVDQQRVYLLLLPYAVRKIEGTLQPQQAATACRAARRCTRQLMALDPGSASLKMLHAIALSLEATQRAQTAAAYRNGLQAALATKAHFQAAQAACSTVAYMMRAGEGPTWSLAEARALLQQAGGFLKLSKPWLWFRSPLLDDVKALTRQVEEAAATRPGAERLPATGAMEDFAFPQNQPSAPCDACGMHSQKLRRCAACKTAAYCSRECQVKHWKQGHKAECAQLAAQRGSGSGSRKT